MEVRAALERCANRTLDFDFGVSGMSFPEEPSAYLRIATEWNSEGQGAAMRALAEALG